jgi:hypothetical protein
VQEEKTKALGKNTSFVLVLINVLLSFGLLNMVFEVVCETCCTLLNFCVRLA